MPKNKGNQIKKKKVVSKSVYDLAMDRARYLFKTFDYVAVSFSGGKDSTVALQVCLDVAREAKRLPLNVYFVDEEVIPPDVDEYVNRIRQNPDINLHWICVPLVYFNNSETQDKWYTWDPDLEDKWVKPKPDWSIKEIPGYDWQNSVLSASHVVSILLKDVPGRVALVLGIRAMESLMRFRMVSRKTHENFITPTFLGDSLGGIATCNKNVWKAYPIYDWSDDDVWLAPNRFGWDYCKAYDKMAMAGLSMHEQRLGPPFGSYSARSLWTWHECWPDMWDKVVERVQGVHTSAMYSKSQLYGKGSLKNIRKPDDLTWEQYINITLNKIKDPALRNLLGTYINRYVKFHYKTTGGMPILGYNAHPESGTCWSHLYRIVERKDKDQRDMPSLQVVPRTDVRRYEVAMQKYLAELKETYG